MLTCLPVVWEELVSANLDKRFAVETVIDSLCVYNPFANKDSIGLEWYR